jgi:hypothetical protein
LLNSLNPEDKDFPDKIKHIMCTSSDGFTPLGLAALNGSHDAAKEIISFFENNFSYVFAIFQGGKDFKIEVLPMLQHKPREIKVFKQK